MSQLDSYCSVSYFFNNYLNSQKQFPNPFNPNKYLLEGTITTDGTKGFINTDNIISINISLKLGASTVETFYFSEVDPNAAYLVSDYIFANNLFATDSHLGIVETYRNWLGRYDPKYQFFLNNQITNKNLTIMDPVENVKILYYINQLNPNTPGFGTHCEYGSENSFGGYRFFNYYEPTVGPEPDFGSNFSFYDPEDQLHMNNEMTADGYGDYAWSSDPSFESAIFGTWVIASNVPEPSALSLLAVGLGGLALLRQSRKKD